MKFIFARRDGEKALYQVATAPTLGEAFRVAGTFRKCSPDGWRAGIANASDGLTYPSPEVADVLSKWTADAQAGKVNATILAIREEEARRHAHRQALVASGRYTWSDFDIADEGDDEGADEE